MAVFKINENEANTVSDLPEVGTKAPDFILTKTDLSNISLKDVAGKKIVLNIFPSIDTPVCSASVRRFNQEASSLPNTLVLCTSRDLPFAHSRFCETEGLKDVVPVSEIRNEQFGNAYGVRIKGGPLDGLFARAVIIIDENGTVIYSKLVEELKNEPNYEDALEVLKSNGPSDNICSKTATAEHSRSSDSDDACDDGRAG